MINSATAGAPEPSPAEDGNSLIDLSTILDKSACYARNENSGFPWGNLFIGDSRLGMQSDADEQLIIHLSFQEFVRVCCFCLQFATVHELHFIYIVMWICYESPSLIVLIRIFNLQVKSIKFNEFNNGTNPELNPVKVHIHINRNNLGFEVSCEFS